MTSSEPEPDALPPNPSRFQFSLRTLLLVFVVLASSLATFGPWGIVLFVLVLGAASYLNQVESLGSALAKGALALLCVMFLIGLLLPTVPSPHEDGRRSQCRFNLQQIARALLNYHQANGCLPPAYIADKSGKPIHSWRVLILPYLECDSLYRAYDFSEPWDGPQNKKLLAMSPTVYACPSNSSYSNRIETNYVAVVGANAAFPGAKSRTLGPGDFSGWASQTIMVVEVADSGISWMEPRDLSLETLGAPGTGVSALAVPSMHDGREEYFYVYDRHCGANVAMADGYVRYLPLGSLSNEGQRKMLEVGAFREQEIDSSEAFYDGPIRPNWPNIAALAVWLLSVGALLTRAVRSRKPRSGSPPEPTPLPPPGSPNE